jgi:oligopeptide transport system substrate-binding protein
VEVDPVKAFALMQQAEDIAMDEVAVIPLYYRSSTFMMAPHVKGYHMSPLAMLFFQNAYVVK